MSQSPDEWDPNQRLLTITEAADSVDRPESTIRRWLTQGLRTYATHGRRPLILEADVLAYDAKVRTPVTPRWDNGNK